jgi:tyrocidine synthetase-2
VEDVFSTLAHGSTLFTGSREIAVHRETFCDYVDTRQICLVNFIPSLLDELLCHERKLESLRIVVAGGERLEANIKNRIISMGYRLFNHYGPTEVTVDALTALCHEDTPVTLGYPIANVECYILNSDRRPVPVGVTGELCIAGVGLARGYLNNPERTAERFPLAVGASFYRFLRTNNFYKTGDFARWLPDGNIQFIGRRDYQVKIRGHRVEPGEIETRLLSRRDIVDAVVTLKEGVSGVKYLCAYIVTADTFEDSGGVSALETYLSLRLPSYMVPMRFVRLERLPRDFNGKIDRKALPEPVVESNSDIFDAPVNHTEKILAIIWQDVLGVDKVGIRDNFFRLGGDSIKAIQVSARLKKHKLTLKLNDLFTFPTIEALGKRVLVSERIIDQGDVAGRVEFTPIQRWFFESDFSCKHHFNHSVMLYSKSGFDERFVQNVFSGIVRHHDALRMIYKNEDGRIVQINRGSRETGGTFFDFDVFDLIGKIDTAGKIEKEAGQIQASFNLETGPLVKLALFKTSEGDHLLIVIHHLVVDGVSWRILLEDFSSGYRQSMCEEKIEFPKKTDSFQYWADQLNVYARSREMMEESAYWDAVRLAAIESLPVDYQIGTVDRKIRYMDVVRLVLGKEETRQLLTDVHKPYNTEINDILLSVLAMAIREWSGCRRIAVNLESHGREQISDTDVSRTVGWFTSQFPVILDSTSVEDISHHIKNVKETLRRIPHGGIGYGLSTYLSPRKQSRDASFFREPEINFNYLGQMNPGRNGSFFSLSVINTGEVVNTDMESVYLLDINGLVIDETLSISFNYFANEYKRDTIRQLADYYRNNLITVIHHCIGKEDEELTPSDVGDEELSFEELEEIREMINL